MRSGSESSTILLHARDVVQYTFDSYHRSDAMATIFFSERLVRLLFKGGYYLSEAFSFFGKPTDIMTDCIKVHTSDTMTTVRRCQY